MASRAGRLRTTSGVSQSEVISPISSSAFQRLQELLQLASSDGESAEGVANNVETLGQHFREIRLVLIDSSHAHGRVKDEFRRLGGAESCLHVLRSLSRAFEVLDFEVAQAVRFFFELIKNVLDVLSEAIWEHPRNTEYFRTQGDPTGWLCLLDILTRMCSVGDMQKHHQATVSERVFSLLFAFSLRDEDSTAVFRPSRSPAESSDDPARRLPEGDQVAITLCHPVAIPIIAIIWKRIVRGTPGLSQLSRSILAGLTAICRSSEHNLVRTHRTGVLRQLLDAMLSPGLSDPELRDLRALCLTLFELGLNFIEDAYFLFEAAITSNIARHTLFEGVKRSRDPAHFNFDLSICGHASIGIGHLKGNYPPKSPAQGYTFICWLRIDEFDEACHTTIFGAFDESQTCFTLLYIERDTHQLVLQTSVTSSKPSIRFKSKTFKPGSWYHIALIHRRPVPDASSRAMLFVNGEFAEQLRCHYPAQPPVDAASHHHARRQMHPAKIQAFFGTPADLSPRVGAGVLKSKWALANAHLVADALPDELLLVYHSLGPCYSGNFQDCLGSFQTYSASARLNLKNEQLHVKSEDRSVIARAIKARASALNPERNLLWNLSALNVVSPNAGSSISQIDSVSATHAIQARQEWPQNPSYNDTDEFVINRVPLEAKVAVLDRAALASMTGSVVAYLPGRIDDHSWRVCGCVPLALKMVGLASSKDDLAEALTFAFDLVRDSWRNSEAFERQNGFALLASSLRSRMRSIDSGPVEEGLDTCTYTALNIALTFVGYHHVEPSKSIIINPLAYKALMIDTDMWRTADLKTQKAYYRQLINFIEETRNRQFNTRRLVRMRLTKKLVDSLKHGSIDFEKVPELLEAIKVCLQHLPSSELYRSLALYITFASSHHASPEPVLKHSYGAQKGTARPTSKSEHGRDRLTETIASRVLRVFAEVLCEDHTGQQIKKFAKTVTTKWLLNLLAVDQSLVVTSAVQILSRLLVVHPASYTQNFSDHSNGFIILRKRLAQWWHVDSLWTACFAVLFGADLAPVMDMSRPFDANLVYQSLVVLDKTTISCPAMFPILVEMLLEGIRAASKNSGMSVESDTGRTFYHRSGDRKVSFTNANKLLCAVLTFLSSAHDSLETFRDYAAESEYVKDIMKALYALSDETSQRSLPINPDQTPDLFRMDGLPKDRETNLEPGGIEDSHGSHGEYPKLENSRERHDMTSSRRLSSFVVVELEKESQGSDPNHDPAIKEDSILNTRLLQLLTDILMSVFADQILNRKDYTGLGLFLKAPPSSPSTRTYMNSYLLTKTTLHLESHLMVSPKRLLEPRTLINLGRFLTQGYEAVIEGWYQDGCLPLIRLSTSLLTYLWRDEVQKHKSVRLCISSLNTMQEILRKASILYLASGFPAAGNISGLDTVSDVRNWARFLVHDDPADVLSEPLAVAVCRCLASKTENDREMIVPYSVHTLLGYSENILISLRALGGDGSRDLLTSLVNNAKQSPIVYSQWLADHSADLNTTLSTLSDTILAPYLNQQYQAGLRAFNTRVHRRKERLEAWHFQDLAITHAWTEHQVSAKHWIENVATSEHLRYLRSYRDQNENIEYLQSQIVGQMAPLKFMEPPVTSQGRSPWQLDGTEGRDRMRLRVSPLHDADETGYEPKRTRALRRATVHRNTRASIKLANISDSSVVPSSETRGNPTESPLINATNAEGFEVVVRPSVDDDDDQNRRVMRSLEKGEEVKNVYNVARIVGLEAREGLLIVGRKCLYLIQGLFQSSDGEVVSIGDAPASERDLYTQILSGHEVDLKSVRSRAKREPVSHWQWDEIINFSKRRFLTRPVALEFFFVDGLSFLITTAEEQLCNGLFGDIVARTSSLSTKSPFDGSSISWRTEMLKTPEESTSRFSHVFGPMFSNPATKRWSKGELTNFQYLMLINTMAGRTFNDITQYPVFPWVLADYTSEELDLTNPRSFRDLTKPMGCQNIERAEAFKERYASFAEMDDTTPAFHYGTHYSSAMIVTSYLIRLQPFVHSHVLLQAGSFDHADRLFYSIQKAWLSASKETPSDVRELIPEFFYLPEFLTNINAYNFGNRDLGNEPVNDVLLPPWAKGDPVVFIHKHREALESPYVTQNLHSWIDLIFGFKQRGEAALEAINVFHHLSYAGSKDLAQIKDQHERAATVGILHNFGLTPTQVFFRPHERRDVVFSPLQRLKKSFMSIEMVKSPLPEHKGPITSLYLHGRQLMAAGRGSILVPPNHDLLMTWTFTDQSICFYDVEQYRVRARFEQVHQRSVTSALFPDDRSLITASEDSTITVWKVKISADDIDLQQTRNLFEHRTPVVVLAASRAFVTLLSASTDGRVLLWDLNHLSLIREISCPSAIRSACFSESTGNILMSVGNRVRIYTLNGRLLVDQDVCSATDDRETLLSCAFLEPVGISWMERDVILTGTNRDCVDVWELAIHADGSWGLYHWRRIRGVSGSMQAREAGEGKVTYVRAIGSRLLVGHEDGRVFEYNAPK